VASPYPVGRRCFRNAIPNAWTQVNNSGLKRQGIFREDRACSKMKLYVLYGDEIRGPFEEEQIVAWRKINILSGESLVKVGDQSAAWVQLDSIIKELPATVDWWWNDATALLRPEKQAKQTSNRKFFIIQDSQLPRLIGEAELISGLKSGSVRNSDLLFGNELSDWTPVGELSVEPGQQFKVRVEIANVGSTSAHTTRSASAVASFLNYLKKRPGLLISTSLAVLLLTFLISWSFPLSVTILIIFLLPCFWLLVVAMQESFLLCVVAFGFFIGVLAIGLKYLDYRFPERGIDRSPIASDSTRKTDGVFESATEKLDKGLPLNEREQQRIYDILTYDEKKKAEEIERRKGERR
jgi:hypothetical protein